MLLCSRPALWLTSPARANHTLLSSPAHCRCCRWAREQLWQPKQRSKWSWHPLQQEHGPPSCLWVGACFLGDRGIVYRFGLCWSAIQTSCTRVGVSFLLPRTPALACSVQQHGHAVRPTGPTWHGPRGTAILLCSTSSFILLGCRAKGTASDGMHWRLKLHAHASGWGQGVGRCSRCCTVQAAHRPAELPKVLDCDEQLKLQTWLHRGLLAHLRTSALCHVV